MNVAALDANWKRDFPDFLPIADELKNFFEERWLRIHTLPGSKRYPDNEGEFAEILRRHNSILSDLFGAKHTYFLLTAGYGADDENPAPDEALKNLGLQSNCWMSINVSDEPEEDPFYRHIYSDEKTWTVSSTDDLLRLVAEDEVRNVMFYAPKKNILYHPYDGGADVFFENSAARDLYREKYKDWLSDHPLGL